MEPRFGKRVTVEYAGDKPVEAIVADNRLPLIVVRDPDKSFDHLSQRFTPATATPATMANLVRQRPFRAFMHASLLVRPPA